jgi:hypothetical protein
MTVSFKDLLLAFEFVAGGAMYENQAFLCKQSGEIYWHSEFGDNFEQLPEDIDNAEKYIRPPDKSELDLGRALVLDFTEQHLPRHLDDVRRIFSKRGAYARFKRPAGTNRCARTMVRIRGEGAGKSPQGMVRGKFNRGRRLIRAPHPRRFAADPPLSGEG